MNSPVKENNKYLSFFNLKHKPFQINTDPRFLWLGDKHKEAFSTLKYGVMDNRGFLLLTGDVGTGKTTLINALLRTLDNSRVHTAFIRDPGLDTLDFFQYTAHAFGLDLKAITSKGAFLVNFEHFLLDAAQSSKRVVLIIDEAQRISQELLEEIRLLSNFEREDRKLLNVFFVGQSECNDILLRYQNRAIRQRITINYNIEALNEDEIRQYIQHRLRVSSDDENFGLFSPMESTRNGRLTRSRIPIPLPEVQKDIFTKDAIQAVYVFSKGCPRLINTICDRAMLTGFVEESRTINRDHVIESAKELEIPSHAGASGSEVQYKTYIPSSTSIKQQHVESKPVKAKPEPIQNEPSTQSPVSQKSVESKGPISSGETTGERSNDSTVTSSALKTEGPQQPVQPIGKPIDPEEKAEDIRAKEEAELLNKQIDKDELKKSVQLMLKEIEDKLADKKGDSDEEELLEVDESELEPVGSGNKLSNFILACTGLVFLVLIAYFVYPGKLQELAQKAEPSKPYPANIGAQVGQNSRVEQAGGESAAPVASEETDKKKVLTAVEKSAAPVPAQGSSDNTDMSVSMTIPSSADYPSSENLNKVMNLVGKMNGKPYSQIVISYLADISEGGSTKNTLSRFYAASIENHLLKQGIDSSKILVMAQNQLSSSPQTSGSVEPNEHRITVSIVQ